MEPAAQQRGVLEDLLRRVALNPQWSPPLGGGTTCSTPPGSAELRKSQWSPAAERRGDEGVPDVRGVVDRAAMEPAPYERECGRTPASLGPRCARRNGAPHWRAGQQGGAIAVSELLLPQWSPSVTGGITPGEDRGRAVLQHAAMEPAARRTTLDHYMLSDRDSLLRWSPPLGGGTASIGTGWIGASGPPQ